MTRPWIIMIVGLIVGTIGYIDDFNGYGTLIPPSGTGWLEVIGLVMVIPTAIYMKGRGV